MVLSTQISIVGGSTGAVALGLGISLGISVPDDMTKINCYQIFGSTNINAMIGGGVYLGTGVGMGISQNSSPLDTMSGGIYRYGETNDIL